MGPLKSTLPLTVPNIVNIQHTPLTEREKEREDGGGMKESVCACVCGELVHVCVVSWCCPPTTLVTISVERYLRGRL